MTTSARVLKNTIFLYIRLGVTLFVSLWTTRIVLNMLGVDNFGIYSVMGGVVAMLGFLNATLSSSTQRYLNFAEGQKDLTRQLKIFNNSFLLHFLLAIFLLVFFVVLGLFCFDGLLTIPTPRIFAAKIVYVCMIASTVMSVMNVPYEASINAHEDMVFYAYVGIFEVISKLTIAFSLGFFTYDRLIIYAFLMLIVPIMTFILMRVYCHKRYDECRLSLKRYFDTNVLKELGSFAGWNFTNSATGIGTQYGLNLVINHYFGVAINAAQGIAMQVSGVLINISSNALKSLNPIIVKSESINQHDRMIYVSLLGCRVTFLIFASISFPLIIWMNEILGWWLKEVPEWAILFCQLQLIRVCLEMLTYGLTFPIMAHGDIKSYNIYKSLINILPLALTIICFYIGLKPYWMYINWIVAWSILGGILNVVYSHNKVAMSYKEFKNIVLIPILKVVIIPVIIVSICFYFTDSILLRTIASMSSWALLLILAWNLLLLPIERHTILNFCLSFINKKRSEQEQ